MPGRLSRTDESAAIFICARLVDANATNTSLLMKLNDPTDRVAGASSTFTAPMPDCVFSASMSNCVNAPSPDQPEASSSIYKIVTEPRRRLAGKTDVPSLPCDVNRHQPAKHPFPVAARKPVLLRQPAHSFRSGVS